MADMADMDGYARDEPGVAGPRLIYKPAKRDKVGLIIGISAPSWAGKTVSALRLARGLVGPHGKIGLLDTENKRALTYADDYEFDHGELEEPFSPARYADAAAISKRQGHDALIVDSMSHEHAGPGGLLEAHEAELNRLTNNSTAHAYRESMKMAAWIKPKMAHKAMVQRLLQLNSHLILCFRAEMKIEIQMLPNKSGKIVATPVSIGFQPIAGKDWLYELTILLGLDQKSPGVPYAIKLSDKFRPFVPLDRVLDEDTGARLAAWSRGEKPEPVATRNTSSTTVDKPPGNSGSVDNPAPAARPPATAQEDKSPAIAEGLIREYQATTSSAAHFALVDDPVKRKQVEWLKRNRKELFQQVNAAVSDSWQRHKTPAAQPPQGALV